MLGYGGGASGSAGGSSVELRDAETAYEDMVTALNAEGGADMTAFEEAVKASSDINYEDDEKDPILLVASSHEGTVQTATRAVGDPVAIRATEILLQYRKKRFRS